MRAALISILLLAALPAPGQFFGGGKDPRWQTLGSGPIAARPTACTANRHVWICTGAGCTANGQPQYCIASGIWSEPASDLYVSAAGDDATGKGTAGEPFATVAKALSLLPPVIAQNYTIHLADGTYAEPIRLTRFYSAGDATITITADAASDCGTFSAAPTNCNLVFSGTTAIDATFGSSVVFIRGPVRVRLAKMRLAGTATNGLFADGGATVTLDTFDGYTTASERGIVVRDHSSLFFSGDVCVRNAAKYGVSVVYNSLARILASVRIGVYGPATRTGFKAYHVAYQSHFMQLIDPVTANSMVYAKDAQWGAQIGIQSTFQVYQAPCQVVFQNITTTPANSAGVLGTDNSSFATNCDFQLEHFTTGFELNSISYAEHLSGARNFYSLGSTSKLLHNSVVNLP